MFSRALRACENKIRFPTGDDITQFLARNKYPLQHYKNGVFFNVRLENKKIVHVLGSNFVEMAYRVVFYLDFESFVNMVWQ